ncbi:hypothetical protein DPM19_19350 [Actinomadura craniellae]|uniref:Serine peptidase n=1 Tax=Actinomadura craniellae TaxID=2231787 RepID=A0A365H3X1_9ACTN|nr:hypothetical protein [Actinomadura craniellae]RAY13810.1 hypothetical protein DPM19_19350 [Actinomadura craniellae]
MATVIGIHGTGKYEYFQREGTAEAASAALGRVWSRWLGEGMAAAGRPGPPVTTGYYAHHLHRGTMQGPDDPGMLDAEAQELLISWVDLLRTRPQTPMGPRTARARGAADWVARKHGDAARRLVTTLSREMTAYLREPAGRRRIAAREAVAGAVRAAPGPVTVLAHSLGSVVAYEALWAHPELRVGHLVTLGSPLGMPGAVFERLVPAPRAGRGARPPGVTRWTNLADVGDLVAIPRTGLSGGFDGVDADHPDLVIGERDFHTARGYLSCPDVARLL